MINLAFCSSQSVTTEQGVSIDLSDFLIYWERFVLLYNHLWIDPIEQSPGIHLTEALLQMCLDQKNSDKDKNL